jgi:hypothetical protein
MLSIKQEKISNAEFEFYTTLEKPPPLKKV